MTVYRLPIRLPAKSAHVSANIVVPSISIVAAGKPLLQSTSGVSTRGGRCDAYETVVSSPNIPLNRLRYCNRAPACWYSVPVVFELINGKNSNTIRSGADSLEGLGMRRPEKTLKNDEVPHAGNIFKALQPFCETQDIGRCAWPSHLRYNKIQQAAATVRYNALSKRHINKERAQATNTRRDL